LPVCLARLAHFGFSASMRITASGRVHEVGVRPSVR
jgi:hypothetical protein